MLFSITAATALFTLALAAPAPQADGSNPNSYENVDVTDFSVYKSPTGIESVSLTLNGNNATDLLCSHSGNVTLPTEVFLCGDSKYRFALRAGEATEFGVQIYHELGLA